MKKGSMLDLFYLPIFLLATAISLFVAYAFVNGMVGTNVGDEVIGAKTVVQHATGLLNMFDYFIVFIMFGFLISTLILAFMIDAHPVFFVVSFIVSALLVLVSSIFSNIYEEFLNTPVFAGIGGNFPILTQMFAYLPTIMMVFSFILMIVMYGRPRQAYRLES